MAKGKRTTVVLIVLAVIIIADKKGTGTYFYTNDEIKLLFTTFLSKA